MAATPPRIPALPKEDPRKEYLRLNEELKTLGDSELTATILERMRDITVRQSALRPLIMSRPIAFEQSAKCSYCGRYGTPRSQCLGCGASVDGQTNGLRYEKLNRQLDSRAKSLGAVGS